MMEKIMLQSKKMKLMVQLNKTAQVIKVIAFHVISKKVQMLCLLFLIPLLLFKCDNKQTVSKTVPTLDCVLDVVCNTFTFGKNNVISVAESQYWTSTTSYLRVRVYDNKSSFRNIDYQVGTYRNHEIYRSFTSLDSSKGVDANIVMPSSIKFIQTKFQKTSSSRQNKLTEVKVPPPTETFEEVHFEYDFINKRIIKVFEDVGDGAKLKNSLLECTSSPNQNGP